MSRIDHDKNYSHRCRLALTKVLGALNTTTTKFPLMSQSPQKFDVSDIGRWPKFTLSSPFVEIVNRIRAGDLKTGHSDWVQAIKQADINAQRARACVIRNDMERALVSYATAAMIFRRAKVHSPAGDSQWTPEEQNYIAAVSSYYTQLPNCV